MAHLQFLVLGTGVLSLVALTIKWTLQPKSSLSTIPGPKGQPLIGNTLQLGPYPQQQLRKWAAEYGEIYKVQIGLQDWVFLNSPSAVRDILDKQSAVTSGRPPMPVLSDAVSGGKRFLLMDYTPRWRKLRAIVHKLLTPKASDVFKPSQEFEAKQLIHDILVDNADQRSFYQHVRRYTTSVVMTSTYGKRIPVWDCEDTREIYGLMKEFSDSAAPGAYLADMIVSLGKLPGWLQWWRISTEKQYRRQERIWMGYWNGLVRAMDEGVAPDCFVKQFAENDFEKQDISVEQAAFVAGTMIEAGSETTSAALNSAILYLARYTDTQAPAHEELSRVVGDDRLPTYADEDSLPYIRAMVKEILRIRPVTSIGSPHYTTADVAYKDHVIPRGTIVSLSQYAIHYDPSRWEDPEVFRPARYLNHPLKAGAYAASGDAEGRDHFDFGAGRRICPGMHLAENSLFITLAYILWLFEVRPPLVGPDGVTEEEEEVVDVSDSAYEEGANTLPKPFRARFVPRSQERVDTLRREWARAQRDGFYLGKVKVNVDGIVVA